MKKILSIFVAFTIVAQLNAQSDSIFVPTQGTSMRYEVQSQGKTYDLILYMTRNESNVYEFEWEMTAPINNKGLVIMYDPMVGSGDIFVNDFSAGTTILSNKESTVFVNQKLMAEIKKGAKIQIDAGKGMETWTKESEGKIDYVKDGEEAAFKTITYKNSSGWKIQIAPIGNIGLIVSQDLNFHFHLTEIL